MTLCFECGGTGPIGGIEPKRESPRSADLLVYRDGGALGPTFHSTIARFWTRAHRSNRRRAVAAGVPDAELGRPEADVVSMSFASMGWTPAPSLLAEPTMASAAPAAN